MRQKCFLLLLTLAASISFDVVSSFSMGVPDVLCDDGQTNISVDWDGSSENYTCRNFKYLKPKEVEPILECEIIPLDYKPPHKCMTDSIIYDTPFPTHEAHRPLWARYGTYRFLPPQRWLHNVEHGAVVMLYHPCTSPKLVVKLAKIITGCIRKHIITPSNLIPTETPLVLITWGCRLKMNTVDPILVKNFIRKRALRGPEGQLSTDGQYDYELIDEARVVPGSTFDDSNLCPCNDSCELFTYAN